ncbi:MAG: SDR family oxidoreductase [Saprospiraceae bacterium]|nr:SDR family oxidoreductase [Saprospiraceae bacterium]
MLRKAVITGATKGIGRAIAESLATEGYDLAVCSRNEADLVAMQIDFAERFGDIKLLTQVVDVSKKEEITKFAQVIDNQWSRVDVLINNAGVFMPGSVHTEGDGLLEMMIETNLYSAYHLTRALLPLMMSQKKGHIFNMCSVASITAYDKGGSYSISKYALLGFSKNLRQELKPYGIKVTSVMPGATWSDSWTGFDAPEERLMQARDVAEVVVSALRMSASAVIEEVVLRPQLGDL